MGPIAMPLPAGTGPPSLCCTAHAIPATSLNKSHGAQPQGLTSGHDTELLQVQEGKGAVVLPTHALLTKPRPRQGGTFSVSFTLAYF